MPQLQTDALTSSASPNLLDHRPGRHCGQAANLGAKCVRSTKRKAISGEIAFHWKLQAYSAWTFSACQPLGPLVTSNCTVWPSCRLLKPPAWIAEKCTKTSSPV